MRRMLCLLPAPRLTGMPKRLPHSQARWSLLFVLSRTIGGNRILFESQSKNRRRPTAVLARPPFRTLFGFARPAGLALARGFRFLTAKDACRL
jgi:hypothetical protein